MKKKIFLFFLFILAMSLFSYFYKTQIFYLKHIEIRVSNLQLSESAQLKDNALDQVKFLYGKSIFLVNFQNIIKKLKENLKIKDVSIRRELPNKIYITITFHNPIVVLMGVKLGVHPVTRDGGILSIQKSSRVPDLPMLRGFNFHSSLELRKKAILIVEKIPKVGLFSQKNISEIRYSKADGFYLYLSPKGVVVKVKLENLSKKIFQIEKVVLYLRNQKINERVIDARLPKKILVKLNKAS